MLEELARLHPLPAKILEYRQNAKLKSTYVDALPAHGASADGPRPCLVQPGRGGHRPASSTDPNLQNIPVRTEEGREIRSAFVPGERGWRLLAADYSQIELRVLAHFSGDAAVVRGVRPGRGHPRPGGQRGVRVPLEQVTAGHAAERRRPSISASSTARARSAWPDRWASSKEEAAGSSTTTSPGIRASKNFWLKVLAECRKNGYVSTILGRRGRFREFATLRNARDSPTEPAGTHRRQHGHPGIGGRPDQAGDDRHPPPAAEEALGADAAADPRRIGLRSPHRKLAELAELVAEEMTGACSWRLES